MKTIPTTYGGVSFRSRTEARWAYFFDLIQMNYDFEREGFELENGEWYVPDFWIPDAECWIEIKGETANHENHCKKLLDVCHQTGTFGFVFVGTPKEMLGTYIGGTIGNNGGGYFSYKFNAGIIMSSKTVAPRFAVQYVDVAHCANCQKDVSNFVIDAKFNETEEYREFIFDAAIKASKKSFWR